ncbi:MAG TPA: PAS domain S-box protein [Candidatus Angelobacter sp.]|nr:PAS domain S-box protein [Candidatus Angelobacter sp.]
MRLSIFKSLPKKPSAGALADGELYNPGAAHDRALIELLPQIIWMTDADGNVIYCNQYWYSYSGLTPEQTAGNGWATILHPEDRPRALANWQNAVATRTPNQGEYRFRRARDGEYRWHLTKGTTIKDDSGNVLKWIGVAFDIHEHKLTDAELAKKDEQLLLAVEAARLGTWQSDYDKEALTVSPRFKEIFGLAPDAVLPREAFFELVHPEDQERVRAISREAFGREASSLFEVEFRTILPDGEVRWVAANGRFRFTDPAMRHQLIGSIGTVQDITGRKLADEAHRTSEERLRAILDAEPECVKLLGRDCTLQQMNAAGLKMIEADLPEQVLSRSVLPLVDEPYREGFRKVTQQAFEGKSGKFEFEITGLKGARRWLQTHATPLFGQAGRVEAMLGITRDITEQKTAESALRASEARFRALIENSSDAIALFDGDWNIVYASAATERIVGYRPQEVLNRNALEFLHPDDIPMVGVQMAECLASPGKAVNLCGRLRHKDGSWRLLEGVFTNLLHDPHVRAVVNNYRDITEKLQAENALRASEEKFKRAFRSSPDAVTLTTLKEGRYIDANDAFFRLTGWEPAEVIGHTAFDLGIWADARDRERMLQMLHMSGRVVSLDTRFYTKTKDELLTQLSAEIIPVEGQECLLVISRDVTEKVRAEEKLRASEERYRSIIENSPYGICQTTREGRFLMVNPALVRMLGYDSAEELLKLDLNTQLYADPLERARLLRVTGLDGGGEGDPGIGPLETTWKRKDGKLISVREAVRGIYDERGGLVKIEGFIADVTQQRALEKQLQTAQKMEAIGELAGGVAHDFNNLLMIMGSRAELIIERGSENERLVKQAEEIRSATRRGATLTRQLLAFSRKQVLQPVVLNLNVLLAELGKMIPRLIGENITTKVITAPNAGYVKVDRGQFEQVIMNLAINARDSMPDGGRLVIETSNIEIDSYYSARYPQVKPGRYVLLSVTDTGTGMDAETQARIFEPFFTTKERGKGTGLGLAMVYGIVEQSGGHISVYSELGTGTSFKIYLPEAALREVKDDDEEMLPIPGGSETILLVEDEQALRHVGEEFLRSKGYEVLVAENGVEALEIFLGGNRPIQLLVTDLIMPHMGGMELARRAAAYKPELPIIFVSGYSGRAMSPGSLAERQSFLQKPFSMATLARQVRAVLDGVAKAEH